MIVRYVIDRGIVGADIVDELEIDDDATDDEVEEAVREELFNRVSFTWEKRQ